MPSVAAELRQRKILERLEREGAVRAAELAKELGVSTVTIRADLAAMERTGLLVRTRGGAVPPSPARFELPLHESQQINLAQKAAIGRLASNLIRNGETIFIDVGSTTTELARALSHDLKDVLIITNALNIALLLENHPGVRVMVSGGTLRALQHSLVNPFGTLLIQEFQADKAFIGCNGVHPQRGVSNANVPEAEVKRAMIAHAQTVYVLADSTKLLRTASARIASTNQVSALITDAAADPEAIQALESAGLQVLLAH